MKKLCPYCAEEIEAAAIKCKHCSEFLALPQEPPPLPLGASAGPWYFRTGVIVMALLSIGPLALPMIWWHPKMTWWWKAIITVGVIGLTWLCFELTIFVYELLLDQLKQLQIL